MPEGVTSNLPAPLTRFVGRERETIELRHRLSTSRLLTLFGPAGSGKTRLGLEVARQVAPRFPDGVWLVRLDAITDPQLVADTLATTVLGAGRPVAALVSSLRGSNALLVLDNCEHVLETCAPLAAELLEACPDLSVLATSRRPLGAIGEQTWHVAPLHLPPHGTTDPEALLGAEAVQLFLDRAGLHPPGVEPTSENLLTVTRICSRLDGLPLGIALAAAWTRFMPVDRIERRLLHRLDLLVRDEGPPRHRSLRAAFNWSYEQLTREQQAVFRRAAVFTGDFDLDAAEDVCSTNPSERERAVHALASLVDASMLIRSVPGRYRMLDSLREYANERLEESGEVLETGRRHAEHYLGVVRQAAPAFTTADAGSWLDRLEQEHSNLTAALAWSELHTHAWLLEMSTRLASFWHQRNHPAEGLRWIDAAIRVLPPDNPTLEANVLDVGASLAVALDLDPAVALSYGERSLRAALASERPDMTVQAHLGLSRAASAAGDTARGLASAREALRAARKWGDPTSIGWAMHQLAVSARLIGRRGAAHRLARSTVRLTEEQGNPFLTAVGLVTWAQVESDLDHHELARDLLARSLRLQLEHRLDVGVLQVPVLELLAGEAITLGDPARAMRLVGAADAILAATGRSWPAGLEGVRDGWLRRAEEALPPRQSEAHRREGMEAPVEDVLRYAIGQEEWSRPRKPGRDRRYVQVGEVVLTRREREIARLVARGRANREIAQELFLSARTVEGHLDRLRQRLGARSRAQIAAWAAASGLVDGSKDR